MADLSVSGIASRLVPPDRGTARVLVQLEGTEREPVVSAARRLHERLAAELRRSVDEGAATEWWADQVWVSTAERWRGDRTPPERVVVATAAVRGTFVDLAALGAWLGAIAELEGVSLRGIDWGIEDDRRRGIEREVRAEALLDARDRAQAYATAVGLGTVELRRVFEPGLRASDDGLGFAPKAARAMMSAESSPEFALRPEELEIGAEVTADFTAG